MKKQPCLECKHLNYNKTEFAALRLKGFLFEKIDTTCNKRIFYDKTHTIDFLTRKKLNSHVGDCQHFEPCT